MSTWTRPLPVAAAAVALLGALTACGNDARVAADPASSSHPTSSPTPGSYPTFAPADYTYRLQVMCYCPLVGPIDVTVAGGEVRSAVVAGGEHKGDKAPAYVRKTINDIIAIANDPKSGDVRVDWPAGDPAPRSVAVNPMRMAADAGVTYVIRDVSAG